jgi:hypothetical protein
MPVSLQQPVLRLDGLAVTGLVPTDLPCMSTLLEAPETASDGIASMYLSMVAATRPHASCKRSSSADALCAHASLVVCSPCCCSACSSVTGDS